jgi:hypothetical protein
MAGAHRNDQAPPTVIVDSPTPQTRPAACATRWRSTCTSATLLSSWASWATKDLEGLASAIEPVARRVIATKADHPRALDVRSVGRVFQDLGVETMYDEKLGSAIDTALNLSTPSDSGCYPRFNRTGRRGPRSPARLGTRPSHGRLTPKDLIPMANFYPPERRVVITGMGALTPLGNNVDEFWAGLLEGRSGIDWITLFDYSAYPVKIDGEVRNFDPTEYMDRKDARRMARFSQFSVAAAGMALADSGLNVGNEDATRIGVLLGNGNGRPAGVRTTACTRSSKRAATGWTLLYVEDAAEHRRGRRSLCTTGSRATTTPSRHRLRRQHPGDGRRRRHHPHGPRRRHVACGGEAGICELGLAGFNIMHALSRRR